MKKKIISAVLTAALMLSSVQFIGTKNVSADTDPNAYTGLGGFVARLYEVCLGRYASEDEIDYWSNTVRAEGNTGTSLAYEFVFSDEFKSCELTNEEFVTRMYSAILSRDASSDPDGIAYWASLMDQGKTREEIFTGFANSDEFFNLCANFDVVAGTAADGRDPHTLVGINYFTNRCYDVILGRECDRAGMAYWSNALATGANTGANLVDSFLFSSEYIAKDKNNYDFIVDLYNSVMGRTPADSEIGYWNSVIKSGRTDRQILGDFVGAPEFAAICTRYGITAGTVGAGLDYARNVSTVSAFTVLSYNEELQALLQTYMPDANYEYVIVGIDNYQAYLDMVLASGDGAPDLFQCDTVDYARRFICSDSTLPVSELGITAADVSQMYGYTFQYGSDNNGNLKALSWQCTPSVVFYNRSVAQRTLGVSEPEQVANYFYCWDAVRNTANIVNTASNGEVKITSGIDDMYRSATSGTSFTVNGQPGLDNNCFEFLDLAKYLYDNSLTWGTGMWTSGWAANATNEKVLSYWGPLWLGKFSLGFQPSDWSYNPTECDWGVVPAPQGSFWGGNFLMASKTCSNKALAGEIMRTLCCDTNVLTDMALNGEFVNNNAVMVSMANNPAWNMEMLNGQNPVNYMIQAAQTINYQPHDQKSSDAFSSTMSAYFTGTVTRSNANAFYRRVLENGLQSLITYERTYFEASDDKITEDAYSYLTDSNNRERSIIGFSTVDNTIVWNLEYLILYGVPYELIENVASNPYTFHVQLYYNDTLISSETTEATFRVTDSWEDGKAGEVYSGFYSTNVTMAPHGGSGLQLGTYTIYVFDSSWNQVEVITINVQY